LGSARPEAIKEVVGLGQSPVVSVRRWSSIQLTSKHSVSAWARVGAIGVLGLAAIGAVDIVGAPTDAQVATAVNEVVSAASDGSALIGQSSSPSLSDDGSVVVFANTRAGSNRLFVRTRSDRAAGARTDVVFPNGDESSVLPVVGAVSGDGCTVAYAVALPSRKAPVATTATSTKATMTTITVAADSAAADEVVVDDGVVQPESRGVGDSVQANSGNVAARQTNGATTELRIVDRCGPVGTTPQQLVLDSLETATALPAPALSIDGSLIAWPVGDEVRVYSAASRSENPAFVSARSGVVNDQVGARLDLSADGRSLVFESGAANVDFGSFDVDAVRPGDPVLTNVYFATLPAANDPAGTTPIVGLLTPTRLGSSGPTISADGALIVYESESPGLFADAPTDGSYLVLVNRTAAIAGIGLGATTQRVLTTGAADASLSADGRAVIYNAFNSVRVRRSDTDARFAGSTEITVNSARSSQFGEAVGFALTVPVISANGALAVFDHVAGVDLTTDASFAADGHVWAVNTSTIFNLFPVTTTSAVPTIPFGTPTPSVQVTSPATTPRTTTRITTRPTAVLSLPAFEPAAFEFAPTIVAVGRRTTEVALVNSGTRSITVSLLEVQPAEAGFAVDGTTCEGQIAAGQQCTVTVSFAPTVAGDGTANLVATLADGMVLASALRGIGAPTPLLSVLPGVATNGQVVTVFGGGFPAGAIVEFSWNDGQVKSNITIDDVGTFAETLVVLPNTTSGPVDMLVAGQTDLFGDVTASVLVTDHGGRSSTAILVGGFGF
jgi:hypothetical protein